MPSRPYLLAQIAAALLPTDRGRAEQLAAEAESAALGLPLDRLGQTREGLIRALLRLGRPHEAELLLELDGPLVAEIAAEYAGSSPGDAERLVDRALSRQRWPSAGEGRGPKIDEADLARLSSAISATRPAQARQLADRAIARAQGHTNPDRKIRGLLNAASNLSARHAEQAVVAIELALTVIAEGGPLPEAHCEAARALVRFDAAAANTLLGVAVDQISYADIHRVAVWALTDPGQAAERAEKFLDQHEEWSWLFDELALVLVGTRDAPGHPSLLPLARRVARLALADDHWSDALTALAALEPATVQATLEWFQDLTQGEALH
jgi:hypothetical protein